MLGPSLFLKQVLAAERRPLQCVARVSFELARHVRERGCHPEATHYEYQDDNDSIPMIPSGTQDYEDAVAILRQTVAEATQLCRSDDFPSVVINQLLDLVIDDYRSKDRYTTYDVEHRITKHLRPFFGAKEPTEVTVTLLEQYARSRASDAAPATINKELAYLRRALRLGHRHEPQLLSAVPPIPTLPIQKHRILRRAGLRSEHRNQRRLLESDMVLDKCIENNGEPGGTRTRDHRIKSAMLYQLSYRPMADKQNFPQNSKRPRTPKLNQCSKALPQIANGCLPRFSRAETRPHTRTSRAQFP